MPNAENTAKPAAEPNSLHQLLADQDTPCPRCGYNLRGLTGPLCPKCAQPVNFDRLLKQERTADLPWIITFVAWAAALPWSVLYVRQGCWSNAPSITDGGQTPPAPVSPTSGSTFPTAIG